MLVDYHVHALGHGEYGHVVEEVIPFLETARERGISEVGFADHDYLHKSFDFSALRKASEAVPDVTVRLGIEIDFYPDKAYTISKFLSAYPLDYVIGSVHAIGDFTFDIPADIDKYVHWDIDALYAAYYEVLAQAAKHRGFDFIGHLDVIKVFNFRPRGSELTYAEPALKAIRDAGLCVEINTNGKYKPVGELYPSTEILKRCFDLSIPITLSSDAHAPENVGRDIVQAAEMARGVGYRQVATFKNRQRIMRGL